MFLTRALNRFRDYSHKVVNNSDKENVVNYVLDKNTSSEVYEYKGLTKLEEDLYKTLRERISGMENGIGMEPKVTMSEEDMRLMRQDVDNIFFTKVSQPSATDKGRKLCVIGPHGMHITVVAI